MSSPLPKWVDLPEKFWRDARKMTATRYERGAYEDFWFGETLPIYNPDNIPQDIIETWFKPKTFRIFHEAEERELGGKIPPHFEAYLIVPIQSRPRKFKSSKSGNEWWVSERWHPYLIGYFSQLKDAYIACQQHSQLPDIYGMFDMTINDVRCTPNQNLLYNPLSTHE